MSLEDTLGRGVVQIGELIATPTSIEDIPDDNGTTTTLTVSQMNDLYLGADDIQGDIIPPVRINSSFGGGPYPFVYDELVLTLIRNFARTRGQIPQDLEPLNTDELMDHVPSYVSTQIIKGKKKDPFEVKVIGIENMDNDIPGKGFTVMDLELSKPGDVTLSFRNMNKDDMDEGEHRLSLTFKTAANGGQFPLVAESFARVARRFAKASMYR